MYNRLYLVIFVGGGRVFKIRNMLVGYCRLNFHVGCCCLYSTDISPFNVFLYPHFYLGITKTIQNTYISSFLSSGISP